MIIGIGVDIIENNRILEIVLKFGKRFLKRVFTSMELQIFEEKILGDNSTSLSGVNKDLDVTAGLQNNALNLTEMNLLSHSNFITKRFAAKEAFSKAIGTGIGEFLSFQDIEIANDDNGKPKLIIEDKAEKRIAKKFNIKTDQKILYHLSLSDSDQNSIAFVVIETCNQND